MNEKKRKSMIQTGILAGVAILFTILAKIVDVQAIGPQNSKVGFATINRFFFQLIGTHKFFYYLTEVLGVVAILVAVMFAGIGLYQLIKRKNLLKVDKNILAMGGIYILVILLYILFEKFAVNYRPVILDEGLEPSYPSSHTMISMCIIGCALIEFRQVLKKSALQVIEPVCIAIIAITVVGRLLSGVHWFTDIIGGLLISAAVVSLYQTVILFLNPKKKRRSRPQTQYLQS